jgi:hypothetical protein
VPGVSSHDARHSYRARPIWRGLGVRGGVVDTTGGARAGGHSGRATRVRGSARPRRRRRTPTTATLTRTTGRRQTTRSSGPTSATSGSPTRHRTTVCRRRSRSHRRAPGAAAACGSRRRACRRAQCTLVAGCSALARSPIWLILVASERR